MLRKRGELTTQEILEIVLAGAAVLVMGFLLIKLISPGVDVNKEYAEGVYVKLEQAAAEMEGSGVGRFSILDVPVDYGDSVFLVLFKGERKYVSLSKYPVEVRNSNLNTYAETSAVPLGMSVRRGYLSVLKEMAKDPELKALGFTDDVAIEATEVAAGKVAILTAEKAGDAVFEIQLRSIGKNLGTQTGVTDEIIEVALSRSKGLSPVEKWGVFETLLGERFPSGNIVTKESGTYTIDSFLKSAKGLSGTNNIASLNKQVAFIAVNDGTTIHSLQVVADVEKFSEETLRTITTGCSVSVSGK